MVIGMNPNKQYAVSPEQRANLLRQVVPPNVQVQVVQGYIWRTVKPLGASLFVRGIRTWERDGKEERTLQIQNTWGPLLLGPLWWPLPTIFLEGQPEFHHISSTLVRQVAGRAALEGLVPDAIVDEVLRLYGR